MVDFIGHMEPRDRMSDGGDGGNGLHWPLVMKGESLKAGRNLVPVRGAKELQHFSVCPLSRLPPKHS